MIGPGPAVGVSFAEIDIFLRALLVALALLTGVLIWKLRG